MPRLDTPPSGLDWHTRNAKEGFSCQAVLSILALMLSVLSLLFPCEAKEDGYAARVTVVEASRGDSRAVNAPSNGPSCRYRS